MASLVPSLRVTLLPPSCQFEPATVTPLSGSFIRFAFHFASVHSFFPALSATFFALLPSDFNHQVSLVETRYPFDLHVLSTPPAFVLSQDQTLMFKFMLSSQLAFRLASRLTSNNKFVCLSSEFFPCQKNYFFLFAFSYVPFSSSCRC